MEAHVDLIRVLEAKDLLQGPGGHFGEVIQFLSRIHLKEPVGNLRRTRILPPEQPEFALLGRCELLILVEEEVGKGIVKLQGEKK